MKEKTQNKEWKFYKRINEQNRGARKAAMDNFFLVEICLTKMACNGRFCVNNDFIKLVINF